MKEGVLLIGLDGATFTILKPLIDRGELPVFGSLLRSGACCSLESTIPPATCQAWTSMVTGKNPGKHGVFDFTKRIDVERKTMSFVNSMCRNSKAIWNLLDENDLRSIVVNVPVTYPPEKINGVMVSGMFTPSINSDFTYPKSVKRELLKRGYIIDVGDASYITMYKKNKKALIDRISLMTRRRAECSLYLMEKYDWDFFMVVFVGLDRLHHLFWNILDPNKRPTCAEHKALHNLLVGYYRLLDNIIGKLISFVGNKTNIILASDHGFRSFDNLFFTNTFLKEKGLLKLKGTRFLRKIGLTENVLLRLASIAPSSIIQRIPIWVQRKIKIKIPSKFYGLFDIDMKKTAAYEYMYRGVRINREAEFCGDSEQEYKEIRKSIIDLLSAERYGEGRTPVFKNIYKREEVYSGPYLDYAPDLILQPNSQFRSHIKISPKKIMSSLLEAEDPSLIWNGEHDMNGILVMVGPSIKRGMMTNRAQIVDVASTLCYLLDIPQPADMDGKVLFSGLSASNRGVYSGVQAKFVNSRTRTQDQ